jgi:hypothetical protein
MLSKEKQYNTTNVLFNVASAIHIELIFQLSRLAKLTVVKDWRGMAQLCPDRKREMKSFGLSSTFSSENLNRIQKL